jgi:hypothetical protein
MTPLQAASAIENLKMETPIKKLNFTVSDKENKPFDADLATLEAQMDAKHIEKTIMSKPTEVSQPQKEAEKTVAIVNSVLFSFPFSTTRYVTRPNISRVKWPTY